MDLLSLRLFVRIARLGGIGKAAAELDLSAASASARLARLEAEVGVRLLHRTTRAVSLTTDGSALLPYAESILETLDQGLGAVGRGTAAPSGTLRMTLPGSFARMHVLPSLGEFARRYPDITLDLRLSDEVLDVVEGAYDLIIRNTALTDSSMIVRKLATDRRLLVASPAYLSAHGTPTELADLKAHRAVVLGDGARWEFACGTALSPSGAHRFNDGEAMRLALEAGLGVGEKSLWNAGDALRRGDLVEVLPAFPLQTRTAIWALHPSGRLVPPRVRAMIDFLLELFTPVPPWERDEGTGRTTTP